MQKKKEHIINSIGTIIFDLDDTLIKTSDLYHQARKKLFSLISEMGFPMEDVVNKLDEIDIQHIKEKGFSKERYPLSLIKTYHYFCNLREINPRAEIEKKIIKIAGEVFEITPQLVDGSEKVLSYLKGKYKLILATLGDREVQQKKIENSGLENNFSAIYIMHFKNTEEYRGIIKDHQLKKERTWLIGNSVRSDLNPGLELGLNCILIPAVTWKFEEEKPISNKYIELESLTEILALL